MSTAFQPAAPWASLRAWIDEQEAFEKQHNKPAPLQPNQLSAISCLIPTFAEPEQPERNYIGDINGLFQTKGLMHDWEDDGPMPLWEQGIVKQMWSSRLVITDPKNGLAKTEEGRFPRLGHGVEAGQEMPVFTTKKIARQYAAKHAFEYLTQHYSSQVPKRLKPTDINMPTKRPKPNSPGPSSLPQKPDSEQSIYARVAQLASRLGLDAPTYRIEAEAELPNFFTGTACFSSGSRVPDGLGFVSGVLGKTEAQRMVAEKVLAWLEVEEQRRRDIMETLLRRPRKGSEPLR